MAKLLRCIGWLFGVGWRRAGDVSLLQWLFPGPWVKAVTVLIGLTGFAGAALGHAPPWSWIPLGLGAAILGLIAVRLAAPLFSKKSVDAPPKAAPEAMAPPGTPQPDWPIRKLFFHIKPDVLDTVSQDDFEAVSDEILDKLSIGQLAAWGRALDGSRRLPLAPIPSSYWLNAKLNVWLLDREQDGGNVLQAHPRDTRAPDQTQYAEIQINHAQAVSIWRGHPVRPVDHDTSLGNAIAYAATGRFNKDAAFKSTNGGITAMGPALTQFYQLARDGKLHVWGRLENHNPLEPIPADYWSTHVIHFTHLFLDQTDVEYGGSPAPHYKDVTVSRTEFEQIWPH